MLLQTRTVSNFVCRYSMFDPAYPSTKSYKKEAIDLLTKHNLMSRVTFRGSITSAEVLDVYQRSDLHVHFTIVNPSWSLLEAMSCGCIVLASDSEILREFTNSNDVCCHVCHVANHDDHTSTAKQILNILNSDFVQVQTMKANARKFVVESFNTHRSETSWKTLITGLL